MRFSPPAWTNTACPLSRGAWSKRRARQRKPALPAGPILPWKPPAPPDRRGARANGRTVGINPRLLPFPLRYGRRPLKPADTANEGWEEASMADVDHFEIGKESCKGRRG